jgi:hypothetical protein
MAQGKLTLLGSFAAPESGGEGFAFALASAPAFEARIPDAARVRGKAEFQRVVAAIEPPFGVLQVPAEGQAVAAGSWAYGWALDDSGIAEIRVETELGLAGLAKLGGTWPGLAEAYPHVTGSASGGFGFAVPNASGPHTLRVTFVANDGGRTTIERRIVIAPTGPEKREARPR